MDFNKLTCDNFEKFIKEYKPSEADEFINAFNKFMHITKKTPVQQSGQQSGQQQVQQSGQQQGSSQCSFILKIGRNCKNKINSNGYCTKHLSSLKKTNGASVSCPTSNTNKNKNIITKSKPKPIEEIDELESDDDDDSYTGQQYDDIKEIYDDDDDCVSQTDYIDY